MLTRSRVREIKAVIIYTVFSGLAVTSQFPKNASLSKSRAQNIRTCCKCTPIGRKEPRFEIVGARTTHQRRLRTFIRMFYARGPIGRQLNRKRLSNDVHFGLIMFRRSAKKHCCTRVVVRGVYLCTRWINHTQRVDPLHWQLSFKCLINK